jgi:S1-C subfamily serine protease
MLLTCRVLGLIALALAPHPIQAQAGGALTTEAIAARAVPATVTIVTFSDTGDTLGMGSGFLVRPNGIVVTNFHVMAGATRAAVILTSGERYDRVEALDQDAAGDIAILKIPG